MALTLTSLKSIPLVKPGDSLADLLIDSLNREGIQLTDGDILIITQKIVSKAENRFMDLNKIDPSPKAIEIAARTEKDARFVELVLQESQSVLRTRIGASIVEHNLGFICANAGIDHSNVQNLGGSAEDWVLLLPQNPDYSAAKIREIIEQRTGVRIGVLIIDSHGRPWRNGTVGVAIGFSGLPGLVDMRGKPDLFGFQLKVTVVAAADELAAAASLMMGQAAENTPVVHARGFPYPLAEGSLPELIRPKELDMFR